jgi:hypothetical protein
MPHKNSFLAYNDDKLKREHTYVLNISYDDVSIAELSHKDRLIISSSKKSNRISDKILGLHLMLVRIEEANHKKAEKERTQPKLYVPPGFINGKEPDPKNNSALDFGADKTDAGRTGESNGSSDGRPVESDVQPQPRGNDVPDDRSTGSSEGTAAE